MKSSDDWNEKEEGLKRNSMMGRMKKGEEWKRNGMMNETQKEE